MTDFDRAVFQVQAQTGSVLSISSFGQFVVPFNSVASPNGDTVYIADQNAGGGTIFRVDVATATQSVLISGDPVNAVNSVAVDEDGFLFAGRRPGPLGPAAIVRVNPLTGATSPVSVGGMLNWPRDMELASDGYLYVLEASFSNGGFGILLRIDVSTGAQTVVASGGYFTGVQGLGTAANGLVYVVDAFAQQRIIRVSLQDGSQSIVSEGGLLCSPRDVAVERDGRLLVTDGCANVECPSGTCQQPSVLRIDPATGNQAVLATEGEFSAPAGIVIFRGGSMTPTLPTTWGAIKARYSGARR